MVKTSSVIDSIRYDRERQALGIEFRNGSRYVYRNVPENTVRRVTESESVGRAYNLYVRDAFPYEKVS